MKIKLLILLTFFLFLSGCSNAEVHDVVNEPETTSPIEQMGQVDLDDLQICIKNKAQSLLETEIEVFFNAQEQSFLVYYQGKQTQEAVNNAFAEIKAYLQDAGFGNHTLAVYGNDGQPLARDENEVGTEEPDKIEVPENVSYNQVGYDMLGNVPLFEIISSEEDNENDGILAMNVLAKELNGENFVFYLVDENEKFLGYGYKNKYTPYVYSTSEAIDVQPSYDTPFLCYFSKYFANIQFNIYENLYEHRIISSFEDPINTCEFTINVKNPEDAKKAKSAMESIVKAMDATLKGKLKTTVIAYKNTNNEIVVKSSELDETSKQ